MIFFDFKIVIFIFCEEYHIFIVFVCFLCFFAKKHQKQENKMLIILWVAKTVFFLTAWLVFLNFQK